MAKKKDIVNEIKGSIGDFVIYKRYGKTFLRQRPKTMNHPNSDAQMEQRHKFSQSNTLAKNYRAAVGHVSLETDEPKSPYNALLGLIRRTGFKGNYPDITWDWNRIQFSEGSLPLPDSLHIYVEGENVQVSWNPEKTLEKGTVFLIAVQPESLVVRCSFDDTNAGKVSISYSEKEHYFVFKEFLAEENTKKSTTARLVPHATSVIDSNVNFVTESQSTIEESSVPEQVVAEEDSDVDISFNPEEFESAVETPIPVTENSEEVAHSESVEELTETKEQAEEDSDVDISFNPEEFESEPVAHESDEVVETVDITVEETVLPEEKIEVKEDSSPKKAKAKSPKKSTDKPTEKAKEDVGPAQLSLF